MSTIATKGAAKAPGTSTGELNLGPYYIQYLPGNHYVLDVYGNSAAKDTQVIGFTVNQPETVNQQWLFVPAGPLAPGWWYLQTLMGSEYVMTLQPHATTGSGPVVMQPKALGDSDTQLWSLLSTEVPGYWYIQSKFGASNAQAPVVIGLTSNTSGASAVANPISFTGFEAQAWGFKPVYW
ncbi:MULTISPECIES: hypothetical protein [Variovorax]|uniref:hypothetical protein n=1 Tax=Variovorax TaxID=34072 RepID=UPI00089A37A0|nr:MULTISPECIES: hypothetical protein [Variovorax]UVH56515.1 hypothetical protein NWF24_27280 [Variovorax paradoxus]SDY41437.1 hypothetical protein SAMN05518854_1011030 [Variovorax sp. YR266]